MTKRNIVIILCLLFIGLFVYFFIHDYSPATCTEPKICAICHKTSGEPLGHEFTTGSCTEDVICNRCKTIVEKAKGHQFIQVTKTYKVCDVCQESEGQIEDLDNPYCDTYLAYNINTDKVVYSKNADQQIAPASLTKLLTICVASEYLNENDILTVGDELYYLQPASSTAGLMLDQTLSFRQALEAMLLPSGNDAAYCIAANVGRKINPDATTAQAIELFIEKMNEYAKELGCKNSHFSSPDGYDTYDQYSCANDLLIIAKKAMTIETITEITAKQEITETLSDGTTYTWKNTNDLLYPTYSPNYEYITGLKTGSTPNAGSCIIISITKNDLDYIVICLGCQDSSTRYSSVNLILDKFY